MAAMPPSACWMGITILKSVDGNHQGRYQRPVLLVRATAEPAAAEDSWIAVETAKEQLDYGILTAGDSIVGH